MALQVASATPRRSARSRARCRQRPSTRPPPAAGHGPPYGLAPRPGAAVGKWPGLRPVHSPITAPVAMARASSRPRPADRIGSGLLRRGPRWGTGVERHPAPEATAGQEASFPTVQVLRPFPSTPKMPLRRWRCFRMAPGQTAPIRNCLGVDKVSRARAGADAQGGTQSRAG